MPAAASRIRRCVIANRKALRHSVEVVGWVPSYLDETNVGALLAEALTADVEAVLADQTSRVGADAAVGSLFVSQCSSVLMSTRMSVLALLHIEPPLFPAFHPPISIPYTIRQGAHIMKRRTTRGSPCRKS